MNNEVVIVYKEVGKTPEFKKVKNTLEEFQNLVGGEIESTDYDKYTIIYRKENKKLEPNIYLEGNLLDVGSTIRGTIFVVNRNAKGEFYSLTKEQAIKCKDLLIRKAFNSYVQPKKKYGKWKKRYAVPSDTRYRERTDTENKKKNNNTQNYFKNLSNSANSSNVKYKSFEEMIQSEYTTEEVMTMILKMQTVIFQFVRKHLD